MLSQTAAEQPEPLHAGERSQGAIPDQSSGSSRRSINRHLVLVVALVSLLLVACGGDSDDDDDEVNVAQEPAATATSVATPTAQIEPTATTAAATTAPTLSIEPSSGAYNTTFNVHFTDLTPRGDYVVVITDPDGTAHSEQHTANSGGTYLTTRESGSGISAGYPFEGWIIEPGDPAGEYVVELRDADGETVLAKTTFTVTEPEAGATVPLEDPGLSIEPASGEAGTYFTYTWSGLNPQAEYILLTTLPDGTEDRIEANANSGPTSLGSQDEIGPYTIDGWLHEESEPTGEFIIQLLDADGETVLAQDTFTVTEPTAAATPTTVAEETPDTADGGPSIRVSPESGTGELPFLFLFTGVTPETIYELAVIYPDGEESAVEAIYDEASMDLIGASGEFEGYPLSLWHVEPGDPDGEYTVELRDPETDEVIASATFTVV